MSSNWLSSWFSNNNENQIESLRATLQRSKEVITRYEELISDRDNEDTRCCTWVCQECDEYYVSEAGGCMDCCKFYCEKCSQNYSILAHITKFPDGKQPELRCYPGCVPSEAERISIKNIKEQIDDEIGKLNNL